jgi:hypothetical protein
MCLNPSLYRWATIVVDCVSPLRTWYLCNEDFFPVTSVYSSFNFSELEYLFFPLSISSANFLNIFISLALWNLVEWFGIF